jgi:thymidylate synthase (FAD)
MDNIKIKIVQRPSVNPIKFIADATRLTFKHGIPFTSNEASAMDKSIVKNLIMADHSPLEHCQYSILIEGASRSFLAQVRTHRLMSFTSASQHYMNFEDMDFEVPIEVFEKCEELNSVQPLAYFRDSYIESHNKYLEVQKIYGLDHSVTRQMTPQAARNNLLFTANIRQLLTLIGRRECGRNTSEIAYVFWLIRKELIKECPEIFSLAGPACYRFGKCSEGKLCCGNVWTVTGNPEEQRYINLSALANKWR